MELSPILAGLEQYPFARLDDWRADARGRGIDVIDFGVGDPREVTPAFIRDALVAGIGELSSYPRAAGLPELREAIGAWIARRYGVAVDADVEVVPTLGSKEAIFSFAQVAVGERRVVAVPEPAYPVYERGALFAGARVVTVPLREDTGWLPGPRRVRRLGRARRVLGLLPEQPDRRDRAARVLRGARRPRPGARLPRLLGRGVLRAVVRRAAGVGAPGRRPRARRGLQHALEALVDDGLPLGLRLRFARGRRRAASLPPVARHRAAGVRPACVGRGLVGRDARRRGARGLPPQARDPPPALEAAGFRPAGGDATFFLWLAVDEPSETVARRLLEHGILVAPGSFFGPAGEGYVRLALVPTQAECERAAGLFGKL